MLRRLCRVGSVRHARLGLTCAVRDPVTPVTPATRRGEPSASSSSGSSRQPFRCSSPVPRGPQRSLGASPCCNLTCVFFQLLLFIFTTALCSYFSNPEKYSFRKKSHP